MLIIFYIVDNLNNIAWLRNKFQFSDEIVATPDGFRCAAVVIPFVQLDGKLHIIFTKRTATVRDHQNQISFPGGACEVFDKTELDAALRELEEEIGIQIPLESVFGALEARKTVTGYFITPFIAFIDSSQKIRPNPAEVDRVIYVPLKWLADPGNYSSRPYSRDGIVFDDVLFFKPFDGETIWGITAKILYDLLQEIKK